MSKNTLAKVALVMLLGGSSSLFGKCPLLVSSASINPAPLTNLGEGEIKFYIEESVGKDVPHLDSFKETTCTLDIDMSRVEVKDRDVTLIEGEVNNFFDLDYNSETKKLRITQKTDIPANSEFQVVVPINVTEESKEASPLNGFIANFLTNASSVGEYTYTTTSEEDE